MAKLVKVRALKRGVNVRLVNSSGNPVNLSTTADVTVDLDLASNRAALAHHSAVGQYIVTEATG